MKNLPAWRMACVCTVLLATAPTTAQDTGERSDVGTILAAQGAPQSVVDSGDAIRRTCLELGAAGPANDKQRDLFSRCAEMSGTVLNTAGMQAGNHYNYGIDDTYRAIRQFSGEESSTQSRLATEGTNRQFVNLGARMDAIRRGARSGISPVAINLQGLDLDRALADTGAEVPTVGGTGASGDRDADTGWAWFANGAVGWGDRDETRNESGYDFDSLGLTLGADYALDNGLTLGLALGVSRFEVDLDQTPGSNFVSRSAGGDIESDGYSLSGFFVYGLDRWYLNGILSYGESEFDMTRRVRLSAAPGAVGSGSGLSLDRRLDASTDSDQLGGQLTGGLVLGTGATTVDLYLGADWLDIDIDGFTERDSVPGGGLALSYASQSAESLQSIAGVMVRHASGTGFGVLLPYAGVEWRHEFDNDNDPLEYRYAFAAPGSTIAFRTPTDEADEDFFEVTLGVSAQFANNLFAFLQYNGSVGLQDTSANLITAGIRGVF